MVDVYKNLIQSLANNKISDAKRYSIDALKSDTTAKDKYFCERYLNLLEKEKAESESKDFKLSANVSKFLVLDDKEVLEPRYYLTSEAKALYHKILATKRLSERLKELKLPTLQAIMLYGESGTGKTDFVRYVAYKLHKPFIYVNFSQVLDSYLGCTQKNIDAIFNFLNTDVDSVFLFDEIDAIGMSRGTGSECGELSRIVIALLQALDKYQGGSMLFAATNRLDILDAALKRRFSLYQEFKPLDAEDVYKFVTQYLSELQISYVDENIRDSVVDYLMSGNTFNLKRNGELI